MQGPPLALILAERALSVKTQSLSPEIIASAKIAMSDTIGVTLLGASSDTAEIARQATAITEQELSLIHI